VAATRATILLRWLIGALLLLIALWLLTVAMILLAGSRPNPTKADAILVLGAAQWNGKPSPVLKARLDHAIDLYQKGLAPYMIVTGGVGRGDSVSEGEVARRYMERANIPAAAILVEGKGITTRESMNSAAGLMRERGLTSAIIVSDSYHLLRAGLLARRAGIKSYRAAAPNSPIDRAPAQRWRYVMRESLLYPATAVLPGR
jgi:uncharacterized SAM-binding protein YcdF (DUF218 family)